MSFERWSQTSQKGSTFCISTPPRTHDTLPRYTSTKGTIIWNPDTTGSVCHQLRVSPEDNSYTRVVSQDYELYHPSGEKLPVKMNLEMGVESSYLDEKTVKHHIQYKIILNGKLVHEGEATDSKDITQISMKRQKAIKVWEDDYQKFEFRYYLTRQYVDATLEGLFKPYPVHEQNH